MLAVDGNLLVVNLPEGTREINVPAGFMFTVNGQQLSVQQLKPGMKGTATITTKTTVTPVTVTQVKSGTVMQISGSSIIVRTEDRMKMFTQADVDKRGVKILRDGQPAQISDFRQGDQLTRDHHYLDAAARHDREGSAGDSRDNQGGCAGVGQCVQRRSRNENAIVTVCGAVPVRGSLDWRGTRAAEDRQLVAASRARERPVARGGMRAEFQPPLRSLRGSRSGPRSCSDERGLLNLSSG